MNRESNRRSMRSLRDGQDSAGKRLRQKETRRKIREKELHLKMRRIKHRYHPETGKEHRRQYQEE